MELFYLFRFEIFAFSFLSFLFCLGIIYLQNYIKSKTSSQTSVLNHEFSQKHKKVKPQASYQVSDHSSEPSFTKKEESSSYSSAFESSQGFYDQFEDMPTDLIHQKISDDPEDFVEKDLITKEKDAMTLAKAMDQEIESNEEGV